MCQTYSIEHIQLSFSTRSQCSASHNPAVSLPIFNLQPSRFPFYPHLFHMEYAHASWLVTKTLWCLNNDCINNKCCEINQSSQSTLTNKPGNRSSLSSDQTCIVSVSQPCFSRVHTWTAKHGPLSEIENKGQLKGRAVRSHCCKNRL